MKGHSFIKVAREVMASYACEGIMPPLPQSTYEYQIASFRFVK